MTPILYLGTKKAISCFGNRQLIALFFYRRPADRSVIIQIAGDVPDVIGGTVFLLLLFLLFSFFFLLFLLFLFFCLLFLALADRAVGGGFCSFYKVFRICVVTITAQSQKAAVTADVCRGKSVRF